MLALVYKTNVRNLVSVSTPVGVSPRMNIDRIVQQGGVWGPMECSNSIDKLGRICQERNIHQYRYKGVVNILPLAMVDDILVVNDCGLKYVETNSFIDAHISMKRLRFHTPDVTGKSKCHHIHVGTKNKWCPELKVHGTLMKKVENDTYLGDIIEGSGSNEMNIKNRVSKGNGIVSQIFNILNNVPFGPNYFKVALFLGEEPPDIKYLK